MIETVTKKNRKKIGSTQSNQKAQRNLCKHNFRTNIDLSWTFTRS